MRISPAMLREALRRNCSKAGKAKSPKKTEACRANAKKRWDDHRKRLDDAAAQHPAFTNHSNKE